MVTQCPALVMAGRAQFQDPFAWRRLQSVVLGETCQRGGERGQRGVRVRGTADVYDERVPLVLDHGPGGCVVEQPRQRGSDHRDPG